MLRARAPAKINLFLHILRRRGDGYHELESLVVFADIADELTLDMSRPFRLDVTGPFAPDCGPASDNLVIKAAHALHKLKPDIKLGAFTLEKILPVASGMGGGSADAAAALRLLAQANALPADHPLLMQAAAATGADVPVCLQSRAAIMSGIGDKIQLVEIPGLPAVLINPGIPLATRDVFSKSRFESRAPVSLPPQRDFKNILNLLHETQNDLATAARELCPAVTAAESELAVSGAKFARPSGSGATVFGLFETEQEARRASQNLEEKYPYWWVKAVVLGKELSF